MCINLKAASSKLLCTVNGFRPKHLSILFGLIWFCTNKNGKTKDKIKVKSKCPTEDEDY